MKYPMMVGVVVTSLMIPIGAMAEGPAPTVPSATRSDSRNGELRVEAGQIEQNDGTARFLVSGVSQQTEGTSALGFGAELSAHRQFYLLSDPGSSYGTFFNVDLGIDAKIELIKDKGVTALDIRSPGLAIYRVRSEPSSSSGPARGGTVDLKLLDLHYLFSDRRQLDRRFNGAEVSVADMSMHLATLIEGVPVDGCLILAPAKLILGEQEIQGSRSVAAYTGDVSICAGLQLGERVHIGNTSRLQWALGRGHSAEAGGYIRYLHSSNVSFSNATQLSVNLNSVKLEAGYTFSREHSENSRVTAVNDITTHGVAVGVAY